MPHRVDTVLGKRIKNMRHHLQMSQTELANQIGVSFQQVQKYEVGTNRVSASRLVRIATALGMTASDLMRGMEDV